MHEKIKQHAVPFIAFGTMGLIAVVALTLPQSVSIPSAEATPPVDTITLPGVVRDFSSAHPDFDITPGDGYGHYTGLVVRRLNSRGRPVYVGDGSEPVEDDFTPPDDLNFGQDTTPSLNSYKVKDRQVATKVTLDTGGALKSMSAYMGDNDKDYRFAIYTDNGDEPGDLIVQSDKSRATKDNLEWHTLEMPYVELDAGTYWLALSFKDDNIRYGYWSSGGRSRIVDHKAAEDGYLATWPPSAPPAYTGYDDAGDEVKPTFAQMIVPYRLAMYATVEIAPIDFHFALGGEGGAAKVTSQWTDSESNPIPPHLAGLGLTDDQKIDFGISNQQVTPTENFAVEVTLLGAAIQNGSSGYHLPVTFKMQVGGDTYEPFGAYLNAISGNVNDNQVITGNANGTNPKVYVVPSTMTAGTNINITGRSWRIIDSDDPGTSSTNWSLNREAETTADGPQVKVLKNGDPVPNVAGMYSQSSIADYVADYVDVNSARMSMGENEVIYLFELGTSGTSGYADFQDLVVVVTLANNPGEFGTDLVGDVDGTPVPSTDPGVTDSGTFDQWYRDVMGVNLSKRHDIVLTDNGSGVYEYVENDFWPIDSQLLGNEGDPHNSFWTYAFNAEFTYDEGAGQFFEVEGGDDTWMFVEGYLAIDLGGIQPGVRQRLDMDRLGLTDGETYTIQFYHARRQLLDGHLSVRTSIDFTPDDEITLSGIID